MKFPVKFERVEGTTLGADVVPVGRETSAQLDNLLEVGRPQNVNGWPLHRIAVGYIAPTSSPPSLTADLYVWDDNAAAWFLVDSKALVKPKSAATGAITWFDCVGLLEPPVNRKSMDDGSPSYGGVAFLLIVDDPGGSPSGTYTFTMAPDLTTF
jgi:hypothetical protein